MFPAGIDDPAALKSFTRPNSTLDTRRVTWAQGLAANSGDSDVESLASNNSGIDAPEQDRDNEVQSVSKDGTDVPIHDSQAEKDLVATRAQLFAEIMKIIELMDGIDTDDQENVHHQVGVQLREHARAIAAIFGDDVPAIVLEFDAMRRKFDEVTSQGAANRGRREEFRRHSNEWAHKYNCLVAEHSLTVESTTELKRKYEGESKAYQQLLTNAKVGNNDIKRDNRQLRAQNREYAAQIGKFNDLVETYKASLESMKTANDISSELQKKMCAQTLSINEAAISAAEHTQQLEEQISQQKAELENERHLKEEAQAEARTVFEKSRYFELQCSEKSGIISTLQERLRKQGILLSGHPGIVASLRKRMEALKRELENAFDVKPAAPKKPNGQEPESTPSNMHEDQSRIHFWRERSKAWKAQQDEVVLVQDDLKYKLQICETQCKAAQHKLQEQQTTIQSLRDHIADQERVNTTQIEQKQQLTAKITQMEATHSEKMAEIAHAQGSASSAGDFRALVHQQNCSQMKQISDLEADAVLLNKKLKETSFKATHLQTSLASVISSITEKEKLSTAKDEENQKLTAKMAAMDKAHAQELVGMVAILSDTSISSRFIKALHERIHSQSSQISKLKDDAAFSAKKLSETSSLKASLASALDSITRERAAHESAARELLERRLSTETLEAEVTQLRRSKAELLAQRVNFKTQLQCVQDLRHSDAQRLEVMEHEYKSSQTLVRNSIKTTNELKGKLQEVARVVREEKERRREEEVLNVARGTRLPEVDWKERVALLVK